MSDEWQTKLTTARMQVDQRFNERLNASEFSRQQWNLIMTAVDFEVDHPDNPRQARLVANTDKLPSIMGELDSIEQSAAMPGPGGAGSDRGTGGSGFFGDLKSLLGLGTGDGDSRLAAAEELAQDYAQELQLQLERDDRWEQIRGDASETHTEHTP